MEESALWHWFSLHARQRMQLVSFWLAGIALLTSGLVAAMDKGFAQLAAGMCVLGIVSSVAFALLDARTRALINAAERMIIANRDTSSDLASLAALLEASDRGRHRWLSYKWIIQGLEVVTSVLFALGLFWVLKRG